ncbi:MULTISPECIES: hypothetical protein [unclassified Paenibacillus]|uniref:hypothetical protein n=1 Tax=unclassified Paenibacillus TaxID=185978 RepID=UPI0030F90D36
MDKSLIARVFPDKEISKIRSNLYNVGGQKIYFLSSIEHMTKANNPRYWFTYSENLFNQAALICLIAHDSNVAFTIEKVVFNQIEYTKGNQHNRGMFSIETNQSSTDFNLVGKDGNRINITKYQTSLFQHDDIMAQAVALNHMLYGGKNEFSQVTK